MTDPKICTECGDNFDGDNDICDDCAFVEEDDEDEDEDNEE